MKKLAWRPLLLAAAVLLLSALVSVPPRASAQVNMGGIMIDVDSHPSPIGIGDGAVIIFVRRTPLPGADVRVVPDPNPAGSPQFVPVQVLPTPADSNYNLVQAYLVRGPGTGTFTMTHKPVPPAKAVIDHVEIFVPDIH
jgi:hypothetical protein